MTSVCHHFWAKWPNFSEQISSFLNIRILIKWINEQRFVTRKCLTATIHQRVFPVSVSNISDFSRDSSRFFFIAYGKTSWIQFRSVAQSCPTLCDPMKCSTPGLPVHHQLPEFTRTHVRVRDAILPSHPLSSPSPPAPNPSQHPGLFQWVNSSHEVAKVLEFQL